jgi:hypothetical protein
MDKEKIKNLAEYIAFHKNTPRFCKEASLKIIKEVESSQKLSSTEEKE